MFAVLRIRIRIRIVRFWLPGFGSGFAKICGSTDPDPMGKISTKNCKKKTFLLLKPKSELMKQKSGNLNEITWIRDRIHFFPVRIRDPDPHQN